MDGKFALYGGIKLDKPCNYSLNRPPQPVTYEDFTVSLQWKLLHWTDGQHSSRWAKRIEQGVNFDLLTNNFINNG
jgi:hypothetical protein